MRNFITHLVYAAGFIALTWGAYYLLTSATRRNEPRGRESVERVLFTPPPPPSELILFDERMPLEYPDVYESLDREIFTNCYYHSATIRILKLMPRFIPIMKPILEAEGVPTDFIYLAVAESALDPSAGSPAGAVGMWQFMRKTAPEYGLEVNSEIDERYHVEKSTYAACKYFKKAYEKFGNWTDVAAAYNAGSAGISRQMERQNQSNYYNLLLNSETARYVFRIAALKVILEDPVRYGFQVSEEMQYEAWKTREVEVSYSIANFPEWCASQGTSYKVLKILNPWLREDHLENRAKKTYFIKLPLAGERI